MSTEREPILLTVPEACRILGGVSRATVWRLVRDDALPHVKVRGRLLFPADGLRDWIDAHVVGAVVA